jgi:glycosyltransferase involved in cell wall biosynthesis
MIWLEKLQVVKVFISKRNRGISHSMNYLVSASKAPIVARMDADDICLPGRFRKGLRLIELGKADFVFGNSILFGLRLRPLFFIPQFPYALDPKTSLLASALRNPFVNSTSVFRKAAFVQTGGCSESIAEDYELFLRAQIQGFKFIVLRSFLVMYRLHNNIHTGQPDFKSKVSKDELLNKAIHRHRQFVTVKFGLDPLSPNVVNQIQDLLIQGSLGFRIRTRFLDPLVGLVLRFLKF